MTCDRPIRDRSGEELPGVTCNLGKGHLGKCAQTLWRAEVVSVSFDTPEVIAAQRAAMTPESLAGAFFRDGATVTPSEPSGQSEPSDPT